MDKMQIAVSLALRDTETCTAAAEVWEDLQIPVVEQSEDHRRVLAVVTHTYTAKGYDSGVRHVDGAEVLDGEREEGW